MTLLEHSKKHHKMRNNLHIGYNIYAVNINNTCIICHWVYEKCLECSVSLSVKCDRRKDLPKLLMRHRYGPQPLRADAQLSVQCVVERVVLVVSAVWWHSLVVVSRNCAHTVWLTVLVFWWLYFYILPTTPEWLVLKKRRSAHDLWIMRVGDVLACVFLCVCVHRSEYIEHRIKSDTVECKFEGKVGSQACSLLEMIQLISVFQCFFGWITFLFALNL